MTKNKNIAVVATGIIVDHVRRLLNGIQKCAKESGANVFIFTCARKYDDSVEHDIGEYNIYNLPNFKEFDGVILLNSTIGADNILEVIVEKIKQSGIMAVGLERTDDSMLGICIDNKAAMREIVEHFVLVHKFTRLNIVTGPLSNGEAKDRLEAYKEILQEYHIPFEEERTFEGNYLKDGGSRAIDAFIKSDLAFPQAIICSNDVTCIGAYEALEQRGMRVPEDVALSGFDDDFDAKYHVPSITSVSRNQEKMGYLACQKALDGIAFQQGQNLIVMPTKMKIRKSCGCHKMSHIDNIDFRRKHYLQMGNLDRAIENLKNMSIDLNSVESFEDLIKYMKIFIPQLSCEELYLYLCNDFADLSQELDIFRDSIENESYLQEGYGNHNYILIGYHEGEFIEQVPKGFHDLLKEMKIHNTSNAVYIVSPIHFRNRCFGYCVIGNGAFPFQNPLFYSWLMTIGNAIETIRKQMLMKAMIQKLDAVWSFDALTGLYNRSGLMKYGTQIWEDGISYRKTGVTVFFMDLDHLKSINDTYGHEEGDRFIKTFAEIIKNNLEADEVATRYGGDEFIIFSLVTAQNEIEKKIVKLKESISEANNKSSSMGILDASIGYYVVYPEGDFESMEDAIKLADDNMYENKRKKKANRVE